ncbi:MAG: ribosome maturation factor RimM [Brevibacterium aurantiacum]|uniref:Ribosome maturation factor RimM n=1 Tax=Brevibacterium aurantiacum TaxID=273384 RepID=A0A1D7W6M4_BREAU|nr:MULTISPECIES: ribosome maturation factor RimM [Brevibacterium]MDN5549789.1 ribosome maturation factor RimM [Brevibacterium sp.]AOP54288.1 16S rRNA processing protein RimM [Brevibacterium aurantiacum]AZL06351.1 ribosome maturation factor RimM [Brevibacterium aurantiacum]AZL09912.1 ribosome maturation factor RimM [Brevibacterium aurantiacum]AZL13562.1 ribosome maturation factor RimM [Brevibacterium aurantiacum]
MDTVIARLGKPHGIKGEFTVEVRTDRPDERLVPGQTYSTDPDIGELTLRTARWHRDRLLLTFDEVPDRNRAEEIRNTLILSDQEDDEVEDDAWYLEDLIGLRVFDGETQVGEIVDVTNGTAQDLLHMKHVDGHQALIPFVTEIVPEVDVEAGWVKVTPPAGLFDAS